MKTQIAKPNTKNTRALIVLVLGVLMGVSGTVMFNRLAAPAPVTAADAVPAPTAAATSPSLVGNIDGGSYTNSSNSDNAQNPPKAPRPPPDEQARAALALIGTDPAAERYWLTTISSPDVPAKERKDLIEDLADVGYTNIRNPTAEDLQIVAYRLQLIQQLAQNPMDNTNAKALAEAQKDLTKTATKALAQAQQQ